MIQKRHDEIREAFATHLSLVGVIYDALVAFTRQPGDNVTATTLAIYEGFHVPNQRKAKAAAEAANSNFDFLQGSIVSRIERIEEPPTWVVPMFKNTPKGLKAEPLKDMYCVRDSTYIQFMRSYHKDTRALEELVVRTPWLGGEAIEIFDALREMETAKSKRDYFSLSMLLKGNDTDKIIDTLRGYLTFGYAPMQRTTIPELLSVHKTVRIMDNLSLKQA